MFVPDDGVAEYNGAPVVAVAVANEHEFIVVVTDGQGEGDGGGIPPCTRSNLM